MQVERIDDMQVGDFIQLPQGEWHLNHAAKAIYAEAQAKMAAHRDPSRPSPQYSVESEPSITGPIVKARLERIR